MGDTFEEALLNSLIATGYKIPSKDKGIMLSSGGAKEKASLLDAAQALVKNGYTIYATAGTAKFLNENNAIGTAQRRFRIFSTVIQYFKLLKQVGHF